jgi:N-acetylglucosamine-6-phosphate deacetylase
VSEVRGRLLVDGRLRPGRLVVENGRIVSVDLDAEGGGAPDDLPVVAPGLVDLHVHGYGGADPVRDLAGMAAALRAAGTTSFQPTLFPDAPARLGETAAVVWEGARALDGDAARVIGLHLEGPFVNPEAAGALPRDRLCAPSPSALREILGPATGDGRGIRTLTVAPELAGVPALLDELARAGVGVSLGHSRATAAEARTAARGRACGATHLFNAMRTFHHREAGLAGFALTGGVRWAEIIGDLCHVGPEAFELALAARGPRELCLVSDALPGAGTGCDVFHWCGRDHVVEDGAAWFETGTGSRALAGSATGQLDQVRRLVRAGVVSLEDALTMATEAPARALGMEDEIGRLVVGARADLIALDASLALQPWN